MLSLDSLKSRALTALISALLLAESTPCLALDPAQYESQINDLALWIIRSTDPSSIDPASPLGVMPLALPESTSLPLKFGWRTTYQSSKFTPDSEIKGTLESILPEGSTVPSRFEVTRYGYAKGISRRTTIGAHYIDFPAFSAWGAGLSWERTLLRRKPLFSTLRLSGSYAKSSQWWTYRGALAELVTGIHYTGFDVFFGVGTRVARIDLPIVDDPGPTAHLLHPLQTASWETHVGTEIFLLRALAVGAGLHWHPQGYGFSVKMMIKSRGNSTEETLLESKATRSERNEERESLDRSSLDGVDAASASGVWTAGSGFRRSRSGQASLFHLTAEGKPVCSR
jgi:hypothetical protein